MGNLFGLAVGAFWRIFGNHNLPALAANPDTITMSGSSSGSFMTNQMHITMSGTIKGVGLMIGGPFYSSTEYADPEAFTLDESITKEMLVELATTKAEEYEAEGKIDDLTNIQGAPVYILSGDIDPIAYN